MHLWNICESWFGPGTRKPSKQLSVTPVSLQGDRASCLTPGRAEISSLIPHPLPCFGHSSTASASASSGLARTLATPWVRHAGKIAPLSAPRTSSRRCGTAHRTPGTAFRRSGVRVRQDERHKAQPAQALDDFRCPLPLQRVRPTSLRARRGPGRRPRVSSRHCRFAANAPTSSLYPNTPAASAWSGPNISPST